MFYLTHKFIKCFDFLHEVHRVTASPYDGIRKGSALIMNMPNPNPTVLCTKLAPAASRIMYGMFSGI